MKLMTIFFLTGLILVTQGAYAADQHSQDCMTRYQQGQNLASNRLWSKFEETTKGLIKNCADVLPFSSLYADLAEAQGEQKKYSDSLRSAVKCDEYGANPECMYRKVLALKSLGRVGDAVQAKEDAIFSCNAIIRASSQNDTQAIGCKRILHSLRQLGLN